MPDVAFSQPSSFGTRQMPNRPVYPSHIRWGLSAVLAISGIFLAMLMPGIILTYADDAAQANAYAAAPICPPDYVNSNCVQVTPVRVTHQYAQNYSCGRGGRSTCTAFSVTLTTSTGDYQVVPVGYAEYQRLRLGTIVVARIWHNSIISAQPDDMSPPITTNRAPASQLPGAAFALLLLPLGAALLLRAVLGLVCPRTPDDLIRDAVAVAPYAPRTPPAGLAASTMTWKLLPGYLWSVPVSFVLWGVYAWAATYAISATPSAPLVIFGVAVLTVFVVLWISYRRAVTHVSTGELADLPILAENVISGKGGPIGLKVWYPLKNGGRANLSIRARWWRRLGLTSSLHVLVKPETGKIWRLLGASDQAGNPIA